MIPERAVARLVPEFLERSARLHPEKIALIARGQALTYAELDLRANRLAHALRARGVGRGDRVLIHGDNSIDVAVAIWAALKADGAFIVVNAQMKADKLAYILADSGAAALIADAVLAATWTDAVLRSIAASPGQLRAVMVMTGGGATELVPRAVESATSQGIYHVTTVTEAEEAQPEHPPRRRALDIDLAGIIYTSGSTGEPKGAMLSHRNVEFASWSVSSLLEKTSDDVVLGVVPMAFNYGLYQLLMAVRVGATLVLERSFAFPLQLLKRVAEAGVTGFPGVPTMFAMLGEMKNVELPDLSRVRYVTSTAAALLPKHVEVIRRLFPNARIYSMYGLTECKRVSWLPPEDLDRKPGSVGVPIPGTEFWTVDAEGNRLGPGESGELVVRGSHVMMGYWKKPELTATFIRPGPHACEALFYTGDLCRIDGEGYLYFIARMDEVIKTRGEKVAPREVEAALEKIEGVLECAVIGVEDPLLGHAVKAFVVLDEARAGQYTEKDIQVRCGQLLENYMVPKVVEFRDALPKTAMGKIVKKGLG